MNYEMKNIYGDSRKRTGHFGITYRGVNMVKCPFDYVLLQMLIHNIKPDLIIEIGTHTGGSALYIADILETIGGKGVIHTIDLKEKKYDTSVETHNRIKLFFGGYQSYDIKNADGFNNILVIDDGSHNYTDVISAFDKFNSLISSGGYYVIEDGIVSDLGLANFFDGGPLLAIDKILHDYNGFIIDNEYCNFFGENYTFNPNGYLKKI